jgi:hypothetical protein
MTLHEMICFEFSNKSEIILHHFQREEYQKVSILSLLFLETRKEGVKKILL